MLVILKGAYKSGYYVHLRSKKQNINNPKEGAMLVLHQYLYEKIIIFTPSNEKIEITILQDSKLGFQAPPEYKILREELLD